MPIPSYFNDFLNEIRLTANQKNDLITGHTTLRDRLSKDVNLSKIIVSTFLQGSYKRATAVRPKGEKRADVDIILVTNLDQSLYSPQQAIDLFKPFCDKYYADKYEILGRSIAVKLSYVDLDIVVTSAPSLVEQELLRSESVTTNMMLEDFSNASDWRLAKGWTEQPFKQNSYYSLLESVRNQAEWQLSPLYIPDREAQQWVQTHPLEQMRWTREKNQSTNTHYVNVVKALKWWRIVCLTDLKYLKGYPIEHMIGECCPDGINSVAEGITKTLEAIVSNYNTHRFFKQVPILYDRGVKDYDVWQRVIKEDFILFYDKAMEASAIARTALEAKTIQEKVANWKLLFGSKFPDAPDDGGSSSNNGPAPKGGFTERTTPTTIGGGRFA